MGLSRFLWVLVYVCLLVMPLQAQERGHALGRSAAPRGAGSAAPRSARPAAHGPVGWDTFRHNEAPARISPHRFGATNFPVPNAWRGDMHGFDATRWQSGRWLHESHNGRLGWWWVIGSDWYFYDTPVYPYPDLYTPGNEVVGWWYWCDPAQEYYPYVTYCPAPWQRVLPRD